MVESYLVRYSLMLLVGILVVMGCATGETGGSFRPDIRRSMAIADPEPRLLLMGPARLLHLDVEKRGPVVVYRVLRRAGTVADCRTGHVEGSAIVKMGRESLRVPNDESLCATVSRRATLSWHAQSVREIVPFSERRYTKVAANGEPTARDRLAGGAGTNPSTPTANTLGTPPGLSAPSKPNW